MILLFQVDLPEKTKLKSNLLGPIALPYKCVRISKRVLIETHFHTYGKESLRRNDLLSFSDYNNEFEDKLRLALGSCTA